jgi:hypothetical protein
MKITKNICIIFLNAMICANAIAQNNTPIRGMNNLITSTAEYFDNSPVFIQHLALDNGPDNLAICSNLFTYLISMHIKSPGTFDAEWQRVVTMYLVAFGKANKYLEDKNIIKNRKDFSNLFSKEGANAVDAAMPKCQEIYGSSRDRYMDKNKYRAFFERQYIP